MASLQSKIEGHQVNEVREKVRAFAEVAAAVRSDLQAAGLQISSEIAQEDAEGGDSCPAGCSQKTVYFVRHGEGVHNVAQRLWREASGYDGVSEPYTTDNDPDGKYVDAELTDCGVSQAEALRPRTTHLGVDLLVVSPLRRATTTGLLAFESHVARGLPVLAHELLHETAGRHTCDRRLPRSALAAAFPSVDYSLLLDEADPLWGDGASRESCLALARRAAAFTQWLAQRPEQRVAVATHSGFLCAMMVSVLGLGGEGAWFGTGEMRTLRLTFRGV